VRKEKRRKEEKEEERKERYKKYGNMEIHNLILFIEINAFVNSKSPLFY
jgi:hypothetical protein